MTTKTELKRGKPGVALLFLMLALFSAIAGAQTKNGKVSKIETAFIYNFTKYVFWPNEDKLKEFTIVLLNSENLSAELNNMAHLVKFRDRVPVKIRSCKSVKDIGKCELLVVDGASATDLWAVYSKIRRKPVLMVASNLKDYKKSMISFTVVDNKMKFIINKTKLEESNLEVKKTLFSLAITKEGEWKSIFEKLNALLNTKEAEVKVEKNELASFLNMYNHLERENKTRELAIRQLEDSVRVSLERLDKNTEENNRITGEIEKQKIILTQQKDVLEKQRNDIFLQGTLISQQRNVIIIITLLSLFVLLLLVFAIRINHQRKRANHLLQQRKAEIERQKMLVDEKQKEILDSIYYAKRIQNALMTSRHILDQELKEYFIMFRPRDIVAGDFYWSARQPGSFIFVTGDSTGHGVPGAFMSLLNISKLNEIVKQKHVTRPDLILNEVRQGIISALNPEGSREESKDGMDAILCNIDFKNLKLQYAAANSTFCLVRGREAILLQADKMPVGKSDAENKPFTLYEVELKKGDMLYTYTDGYADQFGGPKGKKFKHRVLREILIKISELPVEMQKSMLEKQFEDWMGDHEQVDDVCVIGVKI